MKLRERIGHILLTIAAIVGLAGPDALAMLDGVPLPLYLSIPLRVVGFVVALCANGRAVPLVNLIFRLKRRKAEP